MVTYYVKSIKIENTVKNIYVGYCLRHSLKHSHILTLLIHTTILLNKYCYYHCFIHKETVALRGYLQGHLLVQMVETRSKEDSLAEVTMFITTTLYDHEMIHLF